MYVKYIFRVTMNMGAVGGMKRIKEASKVARHVMENTKHTLLVGDGATKFASQMGFKETDLSTNDSLNLWKQWKTNCQPNFWSVCNLSFLFLLNVNNLNIFMNILCQ